MTTRDKAVKALAAAAKELGELESAGRLSAQDQRKLQKIRMKLGGTAMALGCETFGED